MLVAAAGDGCSGNEGDDGLVVDGGPGVSRGPGRVALRVIDAALDGVRSLAALGVERVPPTARKAERHAIPAPGRDPQVIATDLTCSIRTTAGCGSGSSSRARIRPAEARTTGPAPCSVAGAAVTILGCSGGGDRHCAPVPPVPPLRPPRWRRGRTQEGSFLEQSRAGAPGSTVTTAPEVPSAGPLTPSDMRRACDSSGEVTSTLGNLTRCHGAPAAPRAPHTVSAGPLGDGRGDRQTSAGGFRAHGCPYPSSLSIRSPRVLRRPCPVRPGGTRSVVAATTLAHATRSGRHLLQPHDTTPKVWRQSTPGHRPGQGPRPTRTAPPAHDGAFALPAGPGRGAGQAAAPGLFRVVRPAQAGRGRPHRRTRGAGRAGRAARACPGHGTTRELARGNSDSAHTTPQKPRPAEAGDAESARASRSPPPGSTGSR